MRTTRCKCGKEIVFVPITKRDGQPGHVPIDLTAPVYRVLEDIDTGVLTAEQLHAKGAEFYGVSHFATCPHASEFSRRGKK